MGLVAHAGHLYVEAAGPALHAEGVTAGAYQGRDVSQRALLLHAAGDEDFTVGRLRRHAGQALCVPTLDLAGDRQPLDRVSCPRCKAILERMPHSASDGR